MAVTFDTSSYGTAFSSLNSKVGDDTSAAAAKKNTAGKYGANSSSFVSGLMSAQGQDALSKALKELKAQGKERITFDMIQEYKVQLEKEFSDQVRSDLLKLGVDKDINFRLVADPDGSVKVITDHPDKAKIEKYLKDNPKMVEKFQYVQALSNFKKTTEASQVRDWEAMRDLRRGLQAQAIEAFFAAAQSSGVSFASQIASFGSDGSMADYMLGLNKSV